MQDNNLSCFELFPDSYGFCAWGGSWLKLYEKSENNKKMDITHYPQIKSNQDLINFYISKIQYFTNRATYSIKKAIDRFKKNMPDDIWKEDSLLLIKYDNGKIIVEKNQYNGSWDVTHPYPLLIVEMIREALGNKKIPIQNFEMIFSWEDKNSFLVAIEQIVKKNICNIDDIVCASHWINYYLKLYSETPIFMLSNDEKGHKHRYIESEKNIFLLPDLYMFFTGPLSDDEPKAKIQNSEFVNCESMNIVDNVPFNEK